MFFFDPDVTSEVWYNPRKFVPFLNGCYDLVQSFFVSELKKLAVSGKWQVQADERNPQLISYKLYGDTQYWWVLMIYNDIVLPFDELVPGKMLAYPSLSDLAELFFNLNSKREFYGESYE